MNLLIDEEIDNRRFVLIESMIDIHLKSVREKYRFENEKKRKC